MARPLFGREKRWVMPPPRHDKPKKWAVVRYLRLVNDPSTWNMVEKLVVEVYEDTEYLRMELQKYPKAELLIGGLTKLDADMWAKMME
jgi:hypothetical protein